MTAAAECTRCATPLEWGDIRCSICGLAAPVADARPARAIALVLRCTECGAALSYVAEVGAPRCAFCASVMRVEQPVDPIEQADSFVPFQVMPNEAHELLRRWLATLGFFRPADLVSTASIESQKALWWAGWIVSANALVSFTADSDAGSRRSAWAPHSGQTMLDFQDLLISASRGLTLDETSRLTPAVNLALAEPEPRGPEGALIEQFDAQRSAARRIIASAIESTAAARLEKDHIPGRSFRNVHVAVLLHDFNTRRVVLPAYVLAYRYRGKLYRTVIHGQDGRCTFGDAPYSIGKIVLVVALGVLAVLVIVAIIAALSR
jgi:hypothetical protein